jgi:hypothetical protein
MKVRWGVLAMREFFVALPFLLNCVLLEHVPKLVTKIMKSQVWSRKNTKMTTVKTPNFTSLKNGKETNQSGWTNSGASALMSPQNTQNAPNAGKPKSFFFG